MGTPEISDTERPKAKARSCNDLLADFYAANQNENGEVMRPKGEKLRFFLENAFVEKIAPLMGIDAQILLTQLTVYNPTQPIIIKNKERIIARLELREEESSIVVEFADLDDDQEYEPIEGEPIFPLQDPFCCEPFADGEGGQCYIFGGVEVESDSRGEKNYHTVFYKFKEDLSELQDKPTPIRGPDGEKDIRLIELPTGKIGVFGRPQGEYGGRGKITYFEIDSLDDLETELQQQIDAKDPDQIIEGICTDDDWCGANQLHLLPDGRIGVLGHIAKMELNQTTGVDEKSYYPIAFIFDPVTRIATPPKILATMEQFGDVTTKKAELKSVLFSGGLVRNSDGTAWLYVGMGDTEAGRILIKDPFI